MSHAAAPRQASIDVLRAVAIMLMVVVHFVENLSGWYDGGGGPFEGVHRVWWMPILAGLTPIGTSLDPSASPLLPRRRLVERAGIQCTV